MAGGMSEPFSSSDVVQEWMRGLVEGDEGTGGSKTLEPKTLETGGGVVFSHPQFRT
jgi:hypothetical protein